MAPTCWFCGRKTHKGTLASVYFSVCEKAVSQLSPWCQTLQFFPIYYLWLSSCHPSAGAQREWIWVSLCVAPSKGTAWDSSSYFHRLQPPGFYSQKLLALIFCALEPWARGPGAGLGFLTLKTSLPSFYLPHVVWDQRSPSLCVSAPVHQLLGWMWFL